MKNIASICSESYERRTFRSNNSLRGKSTSVYVKIKDLRAGAKRNRFIKAFCELNWRSHKPKSW